MFCQYHFIRDIKKGGNCQVFLAEHLTRKSLCAVKCISKSSGFIQNTVQEAEILKFLKHQSIPILYDIQEDEKYYYLIEEFFDGISLRDYRTNSKISYDTIVRYIIQLCAIIEYLHNLEPDPILYLDLQPDNIFIVKNQIKLIDFGNAVKHSCLQKQKNFYGTLGFAAPEQYEGKEIDYYTDIYGIGAILYYLINGVKPGNEGRTFCAETNRISVPVTLQRIMEKCLRHNPRERYSSVAEVLEQLNNLIENAEGIEAAKEPSLTIAIAGITGNIGATHLSLAFSVYINHILDSCLYEEKNNSNAIQFFAKNKQLQFIQGFYHLDSLWLLPNYKETIQDRKKDFSIIIQDYGEITKDTMEEYLNMDICILVISIKPWERLEKRILNQIKEKQGIILVNFADGNAFQKFQGEYKGMCLRVPYFSEPFQLEKTAWNFMEELYILAIGNKNCIRKSGRWKRFFGKKEKTRKRKRKNIQLEF